MPLPSSDISLLQALPDEPTPLVLAGVDYLQPIYKGMTKYPHVLDDGVSGNVEQLKNEELHERAWRIVQKHAARGRRLAAAQYREGVAKGRASHAFNEILPAAYQGRIASLFVPTGVDRWGRVTPETASVEEHQDEQPGDEELLDLASMQTLLNGGVVYSIKPDEMPDGQVIAATFCY